MQISVQVYFFGTIQNYCTKNSSVQTYIYISTTTLFFTRENSRIRHAVFKITLKRLRNKKTSNMTKFCIFDSYQMVYYLPHFDKLFKKPRSKPILTIFEFVFKLKELEKTFYTQKLRIFHSFPTPYHLRQSDKPFAKNRENTFRPKFHRFSNYF